MFLEQPAHSTWELRWAKRTLPCKHWEPVLSSRMLSDQRCTKRQQPLLHASLSIAVRPAPLAEVTCRGLKEPLPFPPSFCAFSPFRSLNCIVGGNSEVTAHTQERIRQILYPHLGLIRCAETAGKNKNKNNNKTQHTLGKEENLISRVTTL